MSSMIPRSCEHLTYLKDSQVDFDRSSRIPLWYALHMTR